MKSPKNIPASVQQRLLNRAKNDKRPFNELLQYYAMERFLFRLSQSIRQGNRKDLDRVFIQINSVKKANIALTFSRPPRSFILF
jgi:hypothetical protein